MLFCPRCKVSLGSNTLWCPLCGEHSQDSLEAIPENQKYAPVEFANEVRNAEEREKLTPVEYRFLIFELLCVTFGIIFLVTLSSDILFHHAITWSRFTSLSIILLWLLTALPFALWNRPWILFSVLAPSAILCVFLWGIFAGNLSWFLPLGLPLVLLVEGLIAGAVPLIAIQKNRGLNTIAVLLIALALLCAGIDIFVRFFLYSSISLSWSLVVLLSVFPVAGFFFYLHYRIMNRASLRKLFRL
ncbi:MAG TPA: hypothetical protein VJ861_11530 [Treponemataceae bacterium]|nr:hypothetical protein [Treponemataceae bacterium]